MTWWHRLWCKHEWTAVVLSVAPPQTVKISNLSGAGAKELTERVLLGCTSVLLRCHCGADLGVHTVLGQPEAPRVYYGDGSSA